MLTLDRFAFAHWGTWDKGVIDLSVPGTTFVRGRNQDRNGNPNGAGKSSAFNALYALVNGDHQLAVRKRTLGSLTSKATRMQLFGSRDESPFKMEMCNTHLDVVLNGKALDCRKKESARRAVANIRGMPDALWASTVHVNGIAGSPLIRGTSAARCQFLERAFDLDRWVRKHEAVKDVMSGMRRAAADLDDAKAELLKLPPPANIVTLKFSETDLEEARKRLNGAYQKMYDKLATIKALPPKPRRDAAFYERASRDIEARLHRIKATAESHARWLFAKSRQEEVLARRKQLQLAIRQSGVRYRSDIDIDAMQREVDAIKSQQRREQTAARYASVVERWRAIASSVAHRHGIVFSSNEELRSMSRAWVSTLEGGSSKCPICGAPFKGKIDRSILDALARLIDELPDDLSIVATEPADMRRKDFLESKIASARSYLDAKADLSKLVDVDIPPECEHDPGLTLKLARKLSSANKLLERARSWDGMHDVDVDALEKKLDALATRQRESEAELAELRSTIADAVAAGTARFNVEQRIAKLTDEVKLHPIYRGLQMAYATTGMRAWLLAEMLEAIIASLNNLTDSSRDRIEFSYRLTKNRELSIMASNLRGTFDVRMLSGGESAVLCINLLSSLLPLLPDHKRCSVLILDEIDSNCSRQTREELTSEHLPRLAEIVPSLFIVTPHRREEFWVDGSYELLVSKKDGVSSLVRV